MITELPTWEKCQEADESGSDTSALEKFIYEFEDGDQPIKWREYLLAVIVETQQATLKSADDLRRYVGIWVRV